VDSHFLPIVIGFLLDLLIGDPVYRWHPVRLIGSMIQWLESKLYSIRNKRFGGFLLWLLAVSAPLLIWTGISFFLSPWMKFLFSTALYYTLFSFRDLIVHFDRVKRAVASENVREARESVSMIVGRETEKLTLSQCATAAIESMGENSSDGGVSPLFWAMIGGIPGLILFKVTSTLDSMVGYRNKRYAKFGTVSAKIDDVLNYIPSRITAILILLLGRSNRSQWSTFFKNRNHHDSPNAGQVESALAVVTNCRMGGGSFYHGKWVDKYVINSEGDEATTVTMNRARFAIILLYFSLFITLILLALVDLFGGF